MNVRVSGVKSVVIVRSVSEEMNVRVSGVRML